MTINTNLLQDNPVHFDTLFEGFTSDYTWRTPAYEVIEKIVKWAEDRNITAEGGATSYTQIPKLIEEVYEFRDATTEDEAKLEFGDILVVCIQIARLRGLDMVECLDLAYQKIKDRKGRMIDGRFVKE